MNAPHDEGDPCAYLASMIAKREHLRRQNYTGVYMTWAYFDETAEDKPEIEEDGGERKFRYMIVGGCFSEKVKWDLFKEKWQQALSSEGVTTSHAKDFYTFNKPFNWYKDGQRDLVRHDAFRDRLADIILDHVESMIGYFAAARKVKKPVDDAYHEAIDYVMRDACKFAEDSDSKLKMVLAHRDKPSPWTILDKFRNMNWENRLGGCGIFRPEDVLPLQAADYILNAMLSRWRNPENPNEAFVRLREGARLRGLGFAMNIRPQKAFIIDPNTGRHLEVDPSGIRSTVTISRSSTEDGLS